MRHRQIIFRCVFLSNRGLGWRSGKGTALLVGRSRDRFPVMKFFSVATTEPCSLGSTQPLKMSTRDFSCSKGGRCVRLTTYHPRSAECQEIRGLNLLGTSWGTSACCGRPLPFNFFQIRKLVQACYTHLNKSPHVFHTGGTGWLKTLGNVSYE
jgi:hypothetical protein